MKFSAELSALKKALKTANAKKAEKVTFEAKNDLLTVTTKGEHFLSVDIKCIVHEAGALALSNGEAGRILASKEKGYYSITCAQGKTEGLYAMGENIVGTFKALTPDSFDYEKPGVPSFSVQCKPFSDALSAVAKGAEKSRAGKYALDSVLLELDEDRRGLDIVSSDGARLFWKKINVELSNGGRAVLPEKAIKPLLAMVQGEKWADQVNVYFTQDRFFAYGRTFVFSCALDPAANFPDWKRGYNATFNGDFQEVVFEKQELQKVSSMKPFTKKSAPGILFDATREGWEVWNTENRRGLEICPKEAPKKRVNFKLNLHFLEDFLSSAAPGLINMKFYDEKSGFLFVDETGLKCWICPMHIHETREEKIEAAETATKAPKIDAPENAGPNTPPTAEAPEKQAEKRETVKEETAEQEQEKRVKIAPTGSSAPLATVTPAEPAERPSVRASEPAPVESAPLATVPEPENRSAAADQNGHAAAEPVKTAAEPEQVETAAADAEKPFEIGTYTTKKGKIKTSIKFFQPPTPAQIDALKTAFYWEYNGTWNGSPRKLPEIFKH